MEAPFNPMVGTASRFNCRDEKTPHSLFNRGIGIQQQVDGINAKSPQRGIPGSHCRRRHLSMPGSHTRRALAIAIVVVLVKVTRVTSRCRGCDWNTMVNNAKSSTIALTHWIW